MEVIAILDRTIDGIARKAGERFELPDDTDLIEKGVVRAAVATVEASGGGTGGDPDHPVGWVGRFPKGAPVKQYVVLPEDSAADLIDPSRVSEAAARRPPTPSKSTAKRKPLA